MRKRSNRAGSRAASMPARTRTSLESWSACAARSLADRRGCWVRSARGGPRAGRRCHVPPGLGFVRRPRRGVLVQGAAASGSSMTYSSRGSEPRSGSCGCARWTSGGRAASRVGCGSGACAAGAGPVSSACSAWSALSVRSARQNSAMAAPRQRLVGAHRSPRSVLAPANASRTTACRCRRGSARGRGRRPRRDAPRTARPRAAPPARAARRRARCARKQRSGARPVAPARR